MVTLSTRLVALGAAITFATVLSGCISAAPAPTVEADSVRLATSSSTQLSGMEALLTGTLTADANGCVIVEGDGGSVALVWPKGYSVSGDAESFDVLDGDQNVVVSSGAAVSLAGGGVDASGAAETEIDCATGTPWIVGEIAVN